MSGNATKLNYKYLFSISLVTAFGGLLFGYDWVVIGGAKPFYEQFLGIANNPNLQGWAMSCALVGCLIGVVISGLLSDAYGRKKLLITASILFMVSAIGSGASNTFTSFVVYRIIGGVGIGLASNLSPMYIAEVSPPNIRGRYVSINQLTIVIGILAAQIINWQIAEPVSVNATGQDILNTWNGQTGWRFMFWAEMVPAGIFFILMWFVPESPRWLVKNGDISKANNVLSKIGGNTYAKIEIESIVASLKNETRKINYRELFKPGMSKLLIIGVVIAAFQQWCGINVVFNYAADIFEAAGYGVSDMLFNIVITGSINLVFTFVGMYLVDRIGRKMLMLIGSGGLAATYSVLGSFYFIGVEGWPMLILVLIGIACYSMTLAPVTWVIISELFPNRIRGAAMAISTFSLWTASFILVYSFPHLNKMLDASGTFWLYGIISILGFLFVKFRLPETKGKTLEQIEKELLLN